MVNMTRGTIARDIFSDKELYQQEQERIFARAWLYIGHESQIPLPGTFILSKMGEESVILTRDRAGGVRVMLNSCRHRGMRVCRYDEGKTDRFYCPYHGWSYGLDGALKHVTQQKAEYGDNFEASDWGLKQVAHVATFRGMVWATWDSDAPSFDDYLGRRRRDRGAWNDSEVDYPVELEDRRRKFRGGHAAQHQPPVGRSSRHRPQW
jgi:phenylpropionate dioxygenase-like ring-hydroxylating dioxygenase large terminal subunit